MDVFRSFGRRVRSADAFPKTLEDFRVKTASGGMVSVAALTVIAILVLSETASFLTPERTSTITIDEGRNETLQIFLSVDFPRLVRLESCGRHCGSAWSGLGVGTRPLAASVVVCVAPRACAN